MGQGKDVMPPEIQKMIAEAEEKFKVDQDKFFAIFGLSPEEVAEAKEAQAEFVEKLKDNYVLSANFYLSPICTKTFIVAYYWARMNQ